MYRKKWVLWVVLFLLTLFIKVFSMFPGAVELYYSQGVYPYIASVVRFLFGWIPFSIGDLLYAVLIIWLIIKLFRFLKRLFNKQLKQTDWLRGGRQLVACTLVVYCSFNMLWGLNYNRWGIAYQLKIKVQRYSLEDLTTVTRIVEERLNNYASRVSTAQVAAFSSKPLLFKEAVTGYDSAAKIFPFLDYPPRSIKPSMFSYLGNYLGFQGYYNPFTGEGQVNTTVPAFLRPYITCHEMAHQIGYARENEANFVGYLAAKSSPNIAMRYSTYFDLFWYSFREIQLRDTALARSMYLNLHPLVKQHSQEAIAFSRKYKNPIDPLITWLYGHYLRANQQPNGMKSYNEVVGLLIAYYKLYGAEGI
jgi:Protein of unknown function (DUF3810)